MNNLINAIAAVIASKFEHTIYLDELEVKEGFERPSFFIYFISDLSESINRWTYNSNVLVQIVYFSKLDKYENIESTTDQRSIIEALKYIFMSSLGVKFDDKFAHLEKTNIDYTSDKDIFLQLTFNITTSTRQEYDESQNIEPMRDIYFKEGIE